MFIYRQLIKIYVFIIFLLKKILFIRYFDKYNKFKKSHFRSNFAIYDLNDLVFLDHIWITYKAKTEIEKIINKKTTILEYGSGASSFYFKKRCKEVFSIEHDEKYYKKCLDLKKKTGLQINFYLEKPIKKLDSIFKSTHYKDSSFENYVKKPNHFNKKFDLIFIDGRCRDKCLLYSLNFLKEQGVIVFDNSQILRKRYQYALNLLNNYSTLQRYRGLAPASYMLCETAIMSNIDVKNLLHEIKVKNLKI